MDAPCVGIPCKVRRFDQLPRAGGSLRIVIGQAGWNVSGLMTELSVSAGVR